MSPVSYQTIKLSKGKHSSADDGACVMELASMLAGEPFTDHPAAVCPVIGSFMRAYNDSIDDSRRQDLYAYASMVVGSRTSADIQRTRAEFLTDWAQQYRRSRWTRRLVPERLRTITRRRNPSLESVGTHAVHAITKHSDATHAAVLEAIDQLLSIGAERRPAPAFAPDRRARPRVPTA
ncbi:MAG: hypothetical protein ACXVTC_02005 [Solirubrobacteraceae bacterium]